MFYETRENRQRKVFKKSLVICNYASKLQQIIPQIQSQTEQHGTKTQTHTHEHFLFLFDSSLTAQLFLWEREGEDSCNQQQVDIYIYGFFVFVSFEESGRIRRFLPRIGFIFSLKFFGFHTMFTPRNVKKKIIKKKPNCIILCLCVPSNTKN